MVESLGSRFGFQKVVFEFRGGVSERGVFGGPRIEVQNHLHFGIPRLRPRF